MIRQLFAVISIVVVSIISLLVGNNAYLSFAANDSTV